MSPHYGENGFLQTQDKDSHTESLLPTTGRTVFIKQYDHMCGRFLRLWHPYVPLSVFVPHNQRQRLKPHVCLTHITQVKYERNVNYARERAKMKRVKDTRLTCMA